MVPFLDINAQNFALEAELSGAFARVLKSGQFILGPEVLALEKELGDYIDIEHVIGVSSGTDALLLALMSLQIGPGDEVLCPAFTFFATAGCVSRVGATPVFVDVDPITFNIDVADAARKVTGRTKAVIPVHLFGQSADLFEVTAFAREHRLSVIEDAAQSLGASLNGKQAGSWGTWGAFSFYPTKNLGGLGDGGLLVTADPMLAAKARSLRTHGAEKTYHHTSVGGNFRLDSLQAAFLREKLKKLEGYINRRRAHALYYTEKLSKAPGAVIGADGEQTDGARLILPAIARGCEHVWNQYTIRVPQQRDHFREFLTARGVQTAVYYPIPLNRQECFRDYRQEGTCPVSDQLAAEVTSLPIYAELHESQLEQVVDAVRAFLKS